MAVQVLWILLTLVEVIHSEQPVFVPSAAELSDAPPENEQDFARMCKLILRALEQMLLTLHILPKKNTRALIKDNKSLSVIIAV